MVRAAATDFADAPSTRLRYATREFWFSPFELRLKFMFRRGVEVNV
jgi:hypothetical protein